uniref:Fungal lipase-type domain-containing protein n=1 Tax=Kalanchoe fedtschenkoi TaxID=63787 RepID=A0A7N0UEN6_KALFE
MKGDGVHQQLHPHAFQVCGPRNVASPNWKDLISSSWKDGNYKRIAIACFIQAVYLLELDRQESRTAQQALAPNWWLPFKYKLTSTLIDHRDCSIFGAVFEWDRSAGMIPPVRPSGAPRAVLALRGTLLKSHTFRRDIQDDLRFLAWETLEGSVRFQQALEELRRLALSYGSCNVCVAGHSLGAGFALQVGRALAHQGIFVETHLFNPPSLSIAMALKDVGEKVDSAWNRLKAILHLSSDTSPDTSHSQPAAKVPNSAWNWVPSFYGNKIPDGAALKSWVPHLYVNNSDYICCYYNDAAGSGGDTQSAGTSGTKSRVAAKLFVPTKGKQKFAEAHGLEQWWSDDLELQMFVNNSKLIRMQLQPLLTK